MVSGDPSGVCTAGWLPLTPPRAEHVERTLLSAASDLGPASARKTNPTRVKSTDRRARPTGICGGWVVARPSIELSDIHATMSDMASDRITIRIPEALGQRLRHRSRMIGQPESALVREALETYLGQSTEARPAYELAAEAGLIGCIGGGPKPPAGDLSTSPRHMEAFGKSK